MENTKFTLCMIGMAVAIALSLFFSIFWIAETKCNNDADMLNRDTRYRFPGGCYIQTDDGNYIPDDNFIINKPEGE